MRKFFVFIGVLVILIGCSKEEVLNFREGMTFNPDTLMIESSAEGWELYSWHSGETWRYSLLPATIQVKTKEKIYANEFTVNGRDQLKLLFRQLSTGEKIIWYGEEWANNNFNERPLFFELPSLLTQYDVNEFCESKRLELSIVP